MPPGKFSGLKLRVLSGLVLAPLTVALILAGGYVFAGLVVLVVVLAFHEWYNLAQKGPRPVITLLFGAFYLALAAFCYIFTRFGFEAGGWLALSVILCIWASDIGAYFTGKAVGGAKLAPRLSPNKTWAGFGGAVFFAGLALVILLHAGAWAQPWIETNIGLAPAHGWWGVFIAGCILGAVGQGGDLLISFFKRRSGLKDTGTLIPGHGGILDRIDSLLLAAPVFLGLSLVFV